MDTLANRQAQRVTQRAAIAPTTPYESGGYFYQFSGAVDFASMAAGASSSIDVTSPIPLTPGAVVLVGTPAALNAGLVVTAKVKANGLAVTVTAVNASGSTVDPASGTYNFQVAK